MSKLQAEGMGDFTPRAALVDGWYGAQVIDAKGYQKNGRSSLILQLAVIGGPEQPDGNPSEGRKLSDFIALNGYAQMADGGEFVKTKLHKAAKFSGVEIDSAGGFDPDDFIGAQLDIRVRQDVDPQTGEAREQIVGYRPLSEN